MKARVKATGEIVEVENCSPVFLHGALFYGFQDANGIKYLPNEIDLQMYFDYWEACQDETPDTPDYWTRLEHQYAGMAMQGLVTRGEVLGSSVQEIARDIAEISCEIAHALVEKMKEKEERK